MAPANSPRLLADYRNRDNGLIYEMNTEEWKEGENLDFRHADAVDTAPTQQVFVEGS